MHRRVIQEIQTLHDLADTVWSAKSINDVLQAATDRVANLMGADRVATITFDLKHRLVRDFVKSGPGRDLVVATVGFAELEVGLSGWVLKTGQPALSPKGAPDDREAPEVQARRRQTYCGCIVVVPLRHREQFYGTMTAINKPEQPDFGPEDVELMNLFANYCAMVIDNARVLIDLRHAKDEAEASNRAKSDFLAIMSHELRTPLNAIIGFSHLLSTTTLDDNQKEFSQAISTGGENLLGIVNNILDLARMEAGQLTLERQPFRLAPCLNNAAETLGPARAKKGLELDLTLGADLDAYLFGDEARLRQVLVNLLGNAIKFTARGRVSLSATVVRRTARNLLVEFVVSDTGVGIPADKFSRLFQAFSQLDGSSTRQHGGTGLGLAISRSLVRLMGGDIEVESQVGRGSTFRFTLELGLAEAAEPLLAKPRLKVLLVEDYELNQMVVARMVESTGHEVALASSGAEALARFGQQSFDLVFMDLSMPEMDGFETTRRMRELERQQNRTRPLAIIALTAHTLPDLAERCRDAGLDGLLPKPLSLEALQAQLGALPRA